MAGKIVIWNMALGWIGTRTVASETERTQEAVQCSLFWDSARRQALRDFPWNFAQRRAMLASIPMPAGWDNEYKHAYALPKDCLRAQKVFANGRAETRFVIGSDGSSGSPAIFTDAEGALLAYTADVPDMSVVDDLFAGVLARKLACMIAVPLLKNNAQKVGELDQLYRAAIPQAYEADAGEGKERDKPDSWLLARGGYTA